MRCTTSRLIRLISATNYEASQYQDLISIVSPKSNACRIRIRVSTKKKTLLGMGDVPFALEIFEKRVVLQIEMRGLAIMQQETIKWADPPTTQYVHSLGCGATVWPAIQAPAASLVFILRSPLVSLSNSNGRVPRLGIPVGINKRNMGLVDRYK